MANNNPNPDNANANAGAQDGANNANQGGDNNQGQGGNQNNGNGAGNANQNQNNGGNQGAGDQDYKKKFSESTTENQRLMKALQDAGIDPKTGKKTEGGGNNEGNANAGNNEGAGDAPYFTDDELEATFPSFSTMTDQEKQVLRQVGSFPKMARMVAEMHDKLTFSEQLEVIKADPANKLIADNEKEFKAFAYQDNNLKLPLEMLKDAFIGKKLREGNNGGGNGNGNNNGGGDNNQNQNNNRGMENGTNGQGGAGDAVMEMTAEQARDLRKKEPRKYNALARAGKLKIIAGN